MASRIKGITVEIGGDILKRSSDKRFNQDPGCTDCHRHLSPIDHVNSANAVEAFVLD